jgi:hypothetical protein
MMALALRGSCIFSLIFLLALTGVSETDPLIVRKPLIPHCSFAPWL